MMTHLIKLLQRVLLHVGWIGRYFLITFLISVSTGDLVVNVRNQGGESYKQTIRANVTSETVLLQFDSFDGSSTSLVIDFRNEIQLLHTTRLGNQQELDFASTVAAAAVATPLLSLNSINDGDQQQPKSNKKNKILLQSQQQQQTPSLSVYKSYCFVTKFKQHEFIPVDAMAKLRQKNPWFQRTPERTEPSQNISFDIMLDPTASDWISPVIRQYCVGDKDFSISTFAVKSEVSEKASNVEDFENYLRAVRDLGGGGATGGTTSSGTNNGCWDNTSSNVGVETGAGGSSSSSSSSPCTCTISVCIGWYPCALKFCRARNSSSNNNSSGFNNNAGAAAAGLPQQPPLASQGLMMSSSASPPLGAAAADSGFKTYRCGIHTCRVCRNYMFGVRGAYECV